MGIMMMGIGLAMLAASAGMLFIARPRNGVVVPRSRLRPDNGTS